MTCAVKQVGSCCTGGASIKHEFHLIMAERNALNSEVEYESDDVQPGPASKRPKVTMMKGAAVYRTKFKKAWTQTYPFIKEVPGDAYSFLCTISQRQVSCKHQGRHDVERHIGKDLHKSNVKGAKSQISLPFQPLSSALSEKVRYETYNTAIIVQIFIYCKLLYTFCLFQTIRAEVKVATMLVQHNIPLALADELTPLFRDIFSDSEIAKNFSSRRIKTACIINGAITPMYQQALVECMRSDPFAIAIDGSSDSGIEKMNPLTVRIFDINHGATSTRFLDMCMSSSSTAAGIFSKVQQVFTTHSISWNNCVGVGVDNTSVNLGCRNSIKTRIVNENRAAYVMGCPCHIVHNTAGKAGDAFEAVSLFARSSVLLHYKRKLNTNMV